MKEYRIKRAPILYWGIKSPAGRVYTKEVAERLVAEINDLTLPVTFDMTYNPNHSVAIVENAEICGNVVYADVILYPGAPSDILTIWNKQNVAFTVATRGTLPEANVPQIITVDNIHAFTHIYVYPVK
jgi:hypothetical protein